MEFKEVVGWRRSIRFFTPWRPVERYNVQAILDAVHRAPRPLEVDFVRCVVVYRDDLSHDEIESIRSPVNSAQIDMAPVYILFYADVQALERAMDGRNLKQLIDLGLLPESFGWSHRYVDDVIIPQVYQRILGSPAPMPVGARAPSSSETDGATEQRSPDSSLRFDRAAGSATSSSVMALANTAVGIAQAHAILSTFDQGLGTHLVALSPAVMRRICKVPEHWSGGTVTMLVGYHAGSREDGGQRPREPLEETFFEGRYGVPFREDPAVVERLKAEKMIQAPAPLPWRRDELRAFADMLGLPK